MKKTESTIVNKWIEILKNEGYEHHLRDDKECSDLKNFPRIWRKILKFISGDLKKSNNKKIFEFGCGGGKHLANFFVNGWECTGIDCSEDVINRAKNYFKEIRERCKFNSKIDLILGNFLGYESNEKYDIVFQVGVLEHFLNKEERKIAIENMFNLTKEEGYIISIVPSGIHPLRKKIKEKKLGGYNVPEIDYTPLIMKDEFEQLAGREIKIIPHNIMGYLIVDDRKGIYKLINLFVYYFFQIFPAWLLPDSFLFRHAMVLIGIAKK